MAEFSCWILLPPLYSALTAAGLCAVYLMRDVRIVSLGSDFRTGNGTFYPPYISIAGTFPPASCVFSEVMTLAASVGFIIGILRYLQLKSRLQSEWLNVGSLVAFSIGCFGMTLIGNFQVFTHSMIHNAGTLMTFGLGTLFCWVQSFITLRANIKNEGRKTAIARFLLSGVITICMILYKSLQVQRLHVQAAQSQWALVMFFLLFISTFAIEFRHFSFHTVCSETSERPVNASQSLSEASPCQANQL